MIFDDWDRFLDAWTEIGVHAFADLSSGGSCTIEEYLERSFGPQEDPPIPEPLISGEVAMKHVFGRTDLGDFRNNIKNTYGNSIGVTVHVKRVAGQNILTIEDFKGECPMINIVTTSGKKITLNVGKIPVNVEGGIETKRMEF